MPFIATLEAPFTVFKDRIEYLTVEGVDLEVNTIEGTNLSAQNFLANNDINATAACLHLKASLGEDGVPGVPKVGFTLHVSPHLWELLFLPTNEKRIKVVNPFNIENQSTTCVRIGFKAKQMQIKYDLGELDPSNGTLANSQKAKLDDMKGWVSNPFAEYNLKKVSSYFVLVKKHDSSTFFSLSFCLFSTTWP